MRRYSLFLTLLGGLALFGCSKDDDNDFDEVPAIEFVSISPSTAIEYQDSIVVVISYKDKDGDLGENSPDAKNLFLTDSRNDVTYEFRVSELAPAGSEVAIQGQLQVVLTNTAITDGSASQSVTYSVRLKDRAGNTSNTVTTSAITVTK